MAAPTYSRNVALTVSRVRKHQAAEARAHADRDREVAPGP